jgi:Zn-dependent protease with chaperone function
MASAINFFQAQDDARGVMKKMLLKLIILIPLVFAFISASLCLSLVFFSPSFAFISPLAILLLMVGGYLAQLLSSYDDGRGVAASLGGHEVSPNTTDINERRYLNVVQEMALASAMPVPLCYVIADDDNINAFAAGNTVSDAVICITRGSLLCLTRDELQAVVAREFSHLGNGDMRLPMRINCVLSAFAAPLLLAGMLLLLAALLIFAGVFVFIESHGKFPAWGLALFLLLTGLAILVPSGFGLFWASAIADSVGTQRDYLADAAAVRYTRNPLSLVPVLKKVVGYANARRVKRLADDKYRQLFFADTPDSFFWLGARRESICDRIRRLDPNFDGKIPHIDASREEVVVVVPPTRAPAPTMLTEAQVQSAFGFTGTFPDDLRAAASSPVGAMGLVLGLILRQDAALRAEQLKQAGGLAGGEVVKEAIKLEGLLRALPPGYRVPLLDLSMPALRQLSPAQVVEFSEAINQVGCHADDGLVVLLIHASMLRYLSAVPRRVGTVGDLQVSCALILSAVVQTSSEGPAAQAAAYLKGANALGMKHLSLVMIPADQVNLAEVENALRVVADKSVIDVMRRKLLNACCVAMLSDGTAEPAEIEIVRAVGDSLGISFATGLGR